MFGFPSRDVLSGIIGKEITQVCVGWNEVVLRFHDGDLIWLESVDSFYRSNRDMLNISEGPRPFSSVLGKTVTDVEVPLVNELTLKLDSGHILRIHDDSRDGESVTIQLNGMTHII